LSIKAARAGVEAAQNELDWTGLELRAEFRAAYAEWALAAERAAVVMSQVAMFRDVVEKANERKRVGEESGLTAQRLSLALVELEASAARAEAELAKKTALALGRTAVAYTDPRPVLPALPALSSTLELDTHPLLRARRADVDEAEARARLSGRVFLAPELRAGWQTLHDGNQDSEGLVVGAAWSVPLFDRRQGERLAWEGKTRASRGRLEVEEMRARAVLSGAEASYRRLREAALSTEKALEGTDRIMEQAKARFRMGESDVTDLLDAMRSVLSSRMTGLEAHRELELASGRTTNEVQGGGR
jgi:cobalt-zinc-cadmium efflux system outer membrane protein